MKVRNNCSKYRNDKVWDLRGKAMRERNINVIYENPQDIFLVLPGRVKAHITKKVTSKICRTDPF